MICASREALGRAAAQAQEYYAEHGEHEYETVARRLALEEQAEADQLRRAKADAQERQLQQYAELFAAGRRPRTVAEVLADAALYP